MGHLAPHSHKVTQRTREIDVISKEINECAERPDGGAMTGMVEGCGAWLIELLGKAREWHHHG